MVVRGQVRESIYEKSDAQQREIMWSSGDIVALQNLIPEYGEQTISTIYACESSIAEVVHLGPNEIKMLRDKL